MDRKLKERLIGAAVLVVLGVWLIPWILDGPPADEAADVTAALELPLPTVGGAEPLRRETIELEAPRRAEPAAAVATAAPASESGSDPASKPASNEEQAEAAPAPASRTAPAPVPAPPAVAATRTPTPAAASAAPTADEPGWMVQLGSFGDEANARRQSDRVKSFGHDARIFPFASGGRTMYRVRVGAFPTRQRAEATASSLSAHGFPAQIVAPE